MKKTNELFEKSYEKAEHIMQNMTLEEKVAQMFIARYPSAKVNDEILCEKPGGYIFYGKDFNGKTKEQVKEQLATNQSNSKIKMFFAVDEEGGEICRVSIHKAFREEKFQSFQKLYEEGGIRKVIQGQEEKNYLLKSIGLNTNLAPVVDVPTSENSYIFARSMGTSARKTAEYVRPIIYEMKTDRIVGCMKHFPGYGDNPNSYMEIVCDKRDYKQFAEKDFIPFIAGIKSGCPMILVTHIIVECFDEENPASLSKRVHEVLRKDLGFTGIIITDSVIADALKTKGSNDDFKHFAENGRVAIQAVLAGNDMLISSKFVQQKYQLIAAVKDGIIPEEIINNAVRRILACKCEYKIIE